MKGRGRWLLAAGILLSAAAFSGCEAKGASEAIYGVIKLPDGTSAQLYAALRLPQDATLPTVVQNGGPADVMIYTSDTCNGTVYTKNTNLVIAPDFSSATLTASGTKWGDLTIKLAGSAGPPSAPVPFACPDTSANAQEGYTVTGGESASGKYQLGNASGDVSSADIGLIAYDIFYQPPAPGRAATISPAHRFGHPTTTRSAEVHATPVSGPPTRRQKFALL